VIGQMKAMPINDFFAKNGRIRDDGRMVHDMYLVQVKSAEESKNEWDLYKVLATIPGGRCVSTTRGGRMLACAEMR
jgi:branched-chain amino acid transport system substrate-binding protein